MRFPIPDSALAQHIAVLGMTGSGKTSTEKLVIEHVCAQGARVCVLDTLKSDWWGITSSASGRSAGLPFKILGGPRGHVPLHSSAGAAIGQIVGSGKLPLSIIDMADFEAGGVQRFFVDFAQSLWKNARGVVYLVIEEAHEIAPKERAGFSQENMAIHWAKKLATGSRTKGIRLIVATQRVQALHNAVLGSCGTLIAHRVMYDADQEPIIKWLKGTKKEVAGEIAASLSSLQDGEGWLCSGREQMFQRIAFPKFKTFDNTATPDGDEVDVDVKTASVDQEELRAIIGDAVTEAQANDPTELKKRVRELERELSRQEQVSPNSKEVIEAEKRGYNRGFDDGANHAYKRGWDEHADALSNAIASIPREPPVIGDARPENPVRSANVNPPRREVAATSPKRAAGASARQIDGRASSPETIDKPMPRAMLTALAQHADGLTKGQILVHTGYRSSGPVSKCFAELAREGWTSNGGGRLLITEAGLAALGDFEPLPVGEELRRFLLNGDKVSTMEKAMLRALFAAYPNSIAKGAILEATGYASSGPVSKSFARLVALGYAVQSARGELRASEDLFS